MALLHRFPLLTAEQIQNSPSRADGVPENIEARRRKLAAQHMRGVAHLFNLSISTWAIAVTFFNRFYARKSMKKNNTFIVACASLFLAGKVNDEPHSHQRMANELLKAWFGKDNPQLRALAAGLVAQQQQQQHPQQQHPQQQRQQQQQQQQQRQQQQQQQQQQQGPHNPATFWSDMYEAVLEAERALLFTVGFDFNVEIIHTYLARLLKRPRFKSMGLMRNIEFQQYVLSVANDVYNKDSTLVMQYPADKIAVAAFYLVFKMAKANADKVDKLARIPQPAATGADGTPWYVEEGLSYTEWKEITERLGRLYFGGGEKKPAAAGAAGSRPAPSGAVAAGGATSTAMLGACESVAYSGGRTVGTLRMGSATAAAARSELLSDTQGEHTSVPRPLGSDSAAPAPSGSKRPAAGPPGDAPAASAAAAGEAHPVKRARVAEPVAAASNEATSSVLRAPASVVVGYSPAVPGGYSPGSPRPPVYSPALPAGKAAPGAPAASAAAAAAAAAEESEKEEGELEEGELA